MISKRSNVSFVALRTSTEWDVLKRLNCFPQQIGQAWVLLFQNFTCKKYSFSIYWHYIYRFISRLNGRVALLYSAINLKSLVRVNNQSPYSVTHYYSYINKLPYFVLRKTNLCSYHGMWSRWISAFKFKFGTFTTLTKCIRSLLYSSRKWWGNSWFRLWKQQFRQLWWPLGHARLGFWFPGNTHFRKNESREVLWRNVPMQVSRRWEAL